ncbi:MAG: LamG-like jellyroll fold domain-containing protein [Desulfofustis sp.]|nr:LamG-like jellyroll fold domain-containing protein [Desulfofustis sp.]
MLDGTDPLHAAVFTELGTSSKKLSIQSGTTQLPVEIEHWDATAAKAVLHTKVPTYAAAADGELILSYDNSQVDNDTYVGATGDTLAQSVWDANFAAVYHMAQDPSGTAPQLLDSTANNRRLATAGSMAAADLVDGLLGKSIAFDGIDDKAASAAADYSAVATAATIEALVKWGSVAAGEVVLSIGGAVGALQIAVGSSASYIGNGVIGDMADTAIAPDTASSQHLAHTLSGGTLTAYGNGVADPATNTVTVADLSNTSIIVGARYDGSYAEVIVDEVRISTIARSADWIKLTHLSLTDQLITWSAYGEEVDGVDLAAHLIQRYNLTDPLDTWLDQRYGLAVALSGHLEQPYSFLLQAWLAQYYGDARQLRAHLIQRYGNVPVLRAWLEQLYEDGRPLAVWLEQPWQMSAPLLAHLAQRYGIAAGKLETFVEQLYHLHEHPQLAAILLQPYLIGDLERTTHEFDYEASIGGVPVSPHVVNWDFRRSRYYGTIELTLKEQAEALLAVPGAELAFLFGGTDYRFVIEDGWEETSGWSALSYRVAAHSRTKRLGAPHAAPITGTVGPGLASEVCAALVAPYGITLAYQIADCYLAPIEAEGETPIDLIRRILPEQAVLQSGPAGDVLYVQWDVEVPVPRWFTAPPAATIDDLTGFVQTSETSDPQPGYNRYEIVDQQTAQDNSQLVSEQIDGRTMECRQYLSPWDDALAFDLIHTAGSHVSIEPFGIVTRTETETVEIVDGAGRTRYPIDAVLSTAWRAADLGEVAVADDGIIDAEHKRSWDAAHETYTGGDSLLEISYRTRFWRWLVRSPRIEQVQVVSLRVTEEAA